MFKSVEDQVEIKTKLNAYSITAIVIEREMTFSLYPTEIIQVGGKMRIFMLYKVTDFKELLDNRWTNDSKFLKALKYLFLSESAG